MQKQILSILAGFTFVLAPNYANASSQGSALKCNDNITVSFAEGAPVDKFKIENDSQQWQIKTLKIDLASSKGKLIFDTTSGGKGVEVFQPYKQVSGSAEIIKVTAIKDGEDSVSLNFKTFAKGESYTFSIDVDDQLTASELGQIRVSGSEMELAQVNFILQSSDGKQINSTARFNKNNKAILNDSACTS